MSFSTHAELQRAGVDGGEPFRHVWKRAHESLGDIAAHGLPYEHRTGYSFGGLADDVPKPHLAIGHALQAPEVLDGVLSHLDARLDLDGVEGSPFADDQVDLALLRVAVEAHVSRVAPCVHVALEHLGHHKRLEHVPRHGAESQLLGDL